jgi:acetyl-CoA carboxylase carboxyl transferase subunit beta
MNWLQKIMNPRTRTLSTGGGKGSVPEGVWEKCGGCGTVLYRPELERNLMVCPKCGHHHYISARARLKALLDEGSGQELWASMEPADPLKFRDSKKYRDRIVATQKKLGAKDAMVAMSGRLKGRPLMAVAFDFAYMGGSMRSVDGEKITRDAERALEIGSPFVCFSASGGERRKERKITLMNYTHT